MSYRNRGIQMSQIRKSGRVILIAMALVALGACGISGAHRSAPKQLYVLQGMGTPTAKATTSSKPCFTLRINTPASAPGLNTARMAYSEEANRLDHFAYSEWVAPPARMIASAMEARLAASGHFNTVITGSPDVRADLRLDSEVSVLQQDFFSGTSSVRLTVRINLVDPSSRSLMGSKTFSYDEPAAGQNAEAGVAAANRATAQFLDDLVVFLGKTIEKSGCRE